MVLYTYTFVNETTGEIRNGAAYSLNEAARQCGINVSYRDKLPEPWKAKECRAGNMLIWRE